MGRRRRRQFSPEFKAEAIRLVQQSEAPLATRAREIGVSKTTLLSWVEATRPEPREPLTEDERSELARLRRDNRQLRLERDLLKKATAFFARQNE